ncbi:AVAST type 2 anti-phage system protein Avs2 [Botrimarina mediterranea]|uniref:ATP-binding protein n=1 Tax=Botrimarina mediterranea TaxID=2528022 RepID=A0A518K7T2_9BACT|nr:AVAST type 2 anti-phage system protein Avs2 [Botrimarina mediterranea]QDV73853.1 hypothetical protein Spa11_20520 [Botrimarina mediterranea]QDV78483.1 hypothetical protein K2D_20900 [Planctomycetes bacterium K2D]
MQWNQLRAPQEHSFEELCCQLAACEPVADGARFIRNGTPDAGVECYWRLATGDEWCWQAKWFLSSLGSSQWNQLSSSFQTAFEKHPRLRRYYVCLPQDFSDARGQGKKSAQTKWEAWVKKWTTYAEKQGRQIQFELWGSHQLTARLTQPSARGAHWYWFNATVMTPAWFAKLAEQSVANAHDRYTPWLNVDTQTKVSLEVGKRSEPFWQGLSDSLRDLRTTEPSGSHIGEHPSIDVAYEQLRSVFQRLVDSLSEWTLAQHEGDTWTQIGNVSLDDWEQIVSETLDAIDTCRSSLSEAEEKQQAEQGASQRPETHGNPFRDAAHRLSKFGTAVYGFRNFVINAERCGVNSTNHLLVGEAGQGKTHLLCDLLLRDIQQGRPAILFLGEQFNNSDPWGQMISLAGLNCDREQFLGALQAAAQASGKPAILYFDALNEGEGLRLWKKHLAGLAAEIELWDWLQLCLSVRDVYEGQVVPDEVAKRCCRIEHEGFSENTYAAASHFFAVFGIEPSAPLLEPEFDNPLFLKLFCKGIRDSGQTRVPTGLRGVSEVFGFLVDALDRKLSQPDCLDYDAKDRVVRQAVDRLADKMVELGDDHVPKAVARQLLDDLLPRVGHSNSLLGRLSAESLLTVTTDWQAWNSESPEEVVRFAYQRMSDHFFVQRVLTNYVDRHEPEVAFREGGHLDEYVSEDDACWDHGGIIEALAIQLPEHCGRELPNLAPQVATNDIVQTAMLESLVWRNANAFSDESFDYINGTLMASRQGDVFNAMVSLAPIPGHPLNADRLHRVLASMPMPDRDAQWSLFLNGEWGEKRAVERLIDWAQNRGAALAFGNEVVRLAAVALTWFLTSSDRRLRDRATKGLVRLFSCRLALLKPLIEHFADVDDDYVTERLMAVTFGAGSRSTANEDLWGLARYLYERVFADGEPPVHILIRDYARQTVELALLRGADFEVNLSLLRPPYNSRWPEDSEIPSREEVAKLSGTSFHAHIYSDYGNFAKYVTDFSEWCNTPLDGSKPRLPKREQQEFQASLTSRQADSFAFLLRVHRNYRRIQRRRSTTEADFRQESRAEKRFEAALETFLATLRLGSKKRLRFEAYLADYFEAPWDFDHARKINYQAARRWMVKRVAELGWTAKRFQLFDQDFRTDIEAVNSRESIGKKYCWIALYEMQARCADTYQRKDQNFDNGGVCEGPWEIGYCRDIDPSLLVASTGRQVYQNFTRTWWFDVPFDAWQSPVDDVEWLETTGNLPDPKDLLTVVGPDGVRWVTLDGYYEWEQPTRPGYRHWELPTRHVWYQVRGYFVRKADLPNLLEWSKTKKWEADAMPSRDNWNYSVFLGEIYWGRSYAYSAWEEDQDERWTRGSFDSCPVPVIIATSRYQQEHTASDCALDDGVYFDLPCKYLVDQLGLSTGGEDGHWYDKDGLLVAFDPSVTNEGASTLLFREDSLHRILREGDLVLFWALSGKRGRSGGPDPHTEYLGHTSIRGVYLLQDEQLTGSYDTTFHTRGSGS